MNPKSALTTAVLLLLCAGIDAQSFLQQQESPAANNPFSRSEDRKNGASEEASIGRTEFLLVTTFDRNVPGSGKVWVVPFKAKERKNSFVLVAGLQTPTGVCFDKNHAFLYVCDSAQGKVLQFDITLGSSYEFVLASDQVATVLESPAPSACAVDSSGSLYVTDLSTNSISFLEYETLWAGFLTAPAVLYQGSGRSAGINRPVAVAVEGSNTLYFANNLDPEDLGVIVTAPAQSDRTTADLRPVLLSEQKPWGLAISPKFAYFSADDGTVWAAGYAGRRSLYMKSAGFFQSPRGVCYGDRRIYVADFSKNEVYWFPDNSDEEVTPEGFIRVSGAYALACINL